MSSTATKADYTSDAEGLLDTCATSVVTDEELRVDQWSEIATTTTGEEPLLLTQNDGYGYFPGAPGVMLNNRYKIIVKLGWGKSSSTWLVEDKSIYPEEYLSVKVLTAHATRLHSVGSSSELAILKAIARPASIMENPPHYTPAGMNVPTLIDSFEEKGPYGTHLCLVMVAFAPDVSTLMQSCPAKRFNVCMIKRITESVRIALDYLHGLNIVHADVTGSNVFLDLYSVDDIAELLEDIVPKTATHITIDGREYPVMCSQPLNHWCTWGDDGVPSTYDRFRLLGFGSARWSSPNPSNAPFSHNERCAPEVIVGGAFTTKVDIWALGCLVYELLTGESLFQVNGTPSWSPEDDHLAKMISITGQDFSTAFLADCTRRDQYFSSTAELLHGPRYPSVNLRERISRFNIPDLEERDVEKAASFINACLQLDPSRRPTTEDIMWHPFLSLRPVYTNPHMPPGSHAQEIEDSDDEEY